MQMSYLIKKHSYKSFYYQQGPIYYQASLNCQSKEICYSDVRCEKQNICYVYGYPRITKNSSAFKK